MSQESQSSVHLKATSYSEAKDVVSGQLLIGWPLSSSDSLWWKGKNITECNLDNFKSKIKQNKQFRASNALDIKP